MGISQSMATLWSFFPKSTRTVMNNAGEGNHENLFSEQATKFLESALKPQQLMSLKQPQAAAEIVSIRDPLDEEKVTEQQQIKWYVDRGEEHLSPLHRHPQKTPIHRKRLTDSTEGDIMSRAKKSRKRIATLQDRSILLEVIFSQLGRFLEVKVAITIRTQNSDRLHKNMVYLNSTGLSVLRKCVVGLETVFQGRESQKRPRNVIESFSVSVGQRI
jgi:hypothetical protein